jgi:hypothetical protein
VCPTYIFFLGSTSSVPYAKSKGSVSVVTTRTHGASPSVPLTLNQKSSISIASDLEPDFKVAQYSRSDSVESSSGESFDEPKMHDQSALPAGILLAYPPASVPSHLPNKTNSTLHEYSFFEAV